MRAAQTMRFAQALAVVAGSLALAGPAAADATDPAAPPAPVVVTQPDGAVQATGGMLPTDSTDAPVGPGQVITDGADQTEPAPADDAPADATPPKRGEVHVLDTAVASAPAPRPVSQAAPSRVATATAAASPQPAPARRTTAVSARATLPFTGVNAGLIALLGVALVGAGLAVGRAAEPPASAH